MEVQPGLLPPPTDDGRSTHEDRGGLLAFVTDPESEAILRDGLTDVGCTRPDIRRGGLRVAITTLRKAPTPRVLIVDVQEEGDALRALQALSEVAEPSAAVLVIGNSTDLDLYRELTRGLGVSEYLSKPLTRDRIARLFGPVIRGQAYGMVTTSGGRSVTITGSSGGVGATTVAVNLAWHLAGTHRRHTCLLDADLYLGTAALLMDMQLGPGLLSALQAPDRIDALFLERAAEAVADDAVDGRLSLLASETPLADPLDYAQGAAAALLETMRMRYNVVVIDTPFTGEQISRDLLMGATQRVLVLEPTLASIRGAMRLADMPSGSHQTRRPVLVLNRVGRAGGLSRSDVEQTLGKAVDIVIPELPGKVTEAANLGKPLVETNTPFRSAIDDLARQLSIPRLVTPQSAATAVKQRRTGDKTGFGKLRRR